MDQRRVRPKRDGGSSAHRMLQPKLRHSGAAVERKPCTCVTTCAHGKPVLPSVKTATAAVAINARTGNWGRQCGWIVKVDAGLLLLVCLLINGTYEAPKG